MPVVVVEAGVCAIVAHGEGGTDAARVAVSSTPAAGVPSSPRTVPLTSTRGGSTSAGTLAGALGEPPLASGNAVKQPVA